MYRSNGNSCGRSIRNNRGPVQNNRGSGPNHMQPNRGSQVCVNNHSTTQNRNPKSAGASAGKVSGGRNGNPRKPS